MDEYQFKTEDHVQENYESDENEFMKIMEMLSNITAF